MKYLFVKSVSVVLLAWFLLPALADAQVKNRFQLDFEEGFTDRSGAGHDGTPVGGVTIVADPVVGTQSAQFDGTGRIDIDASDIDLRASSTFAAWIKTADDEVNGLIFAEGIDNIDPGGVRLHVSSDRVAPDGLVSATDTCCSALISTTRVDDGEWHHITYVRDLEYISERNTVGFPPHLEKNRVVRGRASLYIDGILDVQGDATGQFNHWRLREGIGPSFSIGGNATPAPDNNVLDPTQNRNDFRGSMDDIQLFAGVLSEDQIIALNDPNAAPPFVCPEDDTTIGTISVEQLSAAEFRAGAYKVRVADSNDASGDPILYQYTLIQTAGTVEDHGVPRQIGPQEDDAKEFTVTVGNPPVEEVRVVTRAGNEAIFNGIFAGTYVVEVQVTDQDNLPCKDNANPGPDLADNTALSPEIVVEPLPDFVYKVSSFGGGRQLWYQAEDIDVADGAFALGDPGGWKIIEHAGASNGKVITRAPINGTNFGIGARGGRLIRRFDISLAGLEEGQHFFWARTINQFNTSEFGLIAEDPDDADLPTEPDEMGFFAPNFPSGDDRIYEEDGLYSFSWQKLDLIVRPERGDEGHEKRLGDGVNEHHIFARQGGSTLEVDVHVWTDDPLYLPTDEDLANATTLRPFQRGDCNGDGGTDLSDGVSLLNFAFLGAGEPVCLDACDFNANGVADITTSVYFFNALFQGGPAIPPPSECGFAAPLIGCNEGSCVP